jgi:hypothetical protein
MSDSILVLSPEVAVARQIAESLQAGGFTVGMTTTVQETIQKLRQCDWEMFLVDMKQTLPPVVPLLVSLRKSMPHLALGIYCATPPPAALQTALREAALECVLLEKKISPDAIAALLLDHHLAMEKKNHAVQLGLRADQVVDLRVNYEAADMAREVARIIGVLAQQPDLRVPIAPWILEALPPALEALPATDKEMAQLIQLDAGLTFLILQTANASPDQPPLCKVQEAMERLGEDQTRALLLEKAPDYVFQAKLEGVTELFRTQWMHQLACSVSNNLYAQWMRMDAPDGFHLIGLLHDIGALVMLQLLDKGYQHALWTQRMCGKDGFARRVIIEGREHMDLTSQLLYASRLPAIFSQVANECETPQNILSSPDSLILTFFSNQLARKCGYDLVEYDSELDPVSREDIRQQLNMEADAYQKIEKSLLNQIRQTSRQFNLPVSGS